MQYRAVVVIPIYSLTINKWEEISLRQCVKVLGVDSITFIAPNSLDITLYQQISGCTRVERFDDVFFENLAGYNLLMLKPDFYERFQQYDYMLIHQLDAYVFSNQLQQWCDKGYDYIGAPWIPSIKYNSTWRRTELRASQFLYRLLNLYNARSNYFQTGNGGFSLRKISACLEVLKTDGHYIEQFLSHESHHYAEDIYWSIRANRIKSRLYIPHSYEAIPFAFENHPEQLYLLNNKQLPFGAHAWYKGTRIHFWQQFIEMNSLSRD